MCLSNLNVGLQPEQVIDAIAESEDAESYIMAMIERVGDEGFTIGLMRRMAAWVAAGGEDAEDRRESRDWIMSEIDDEFAGKI